jgi:hypothetical protein
VQLQETFDRASSEIGEAVKAIEERNKEERNKNKAKTKSAATPKKEDKSPEPEKAKSDDTLPLWWTDKSVLPPGVAAPVPSAPAPSEPSAQPEDQENRNLEVTQQ